MQRGGGGRPPPRGGAAQSSSARGGGGGAGGRHSTFQGQRRPNFNKPPSGADGVEEGFRLQIDRALLDFRNGTEESLTFPATLDNTERRYVHFMAGKLGLHSKSSGKKDARQLSIYRSKKSAGGADHHPSGPASNAAPLALHPLSEDAIARHFEAFPPSVADTSSAVEEIISPHTPQSGATNSTHGRSNKRQRPSEGPGSGQGGGMSGGAAEASSRAAWASALRERHASPSWPEMHSARMRLPAWGIQSKLSAALASGQVVILCGETGSGKSTQVPQFILDDPVTGHAANVIVTQPRRIAAISLAERVAAERCEEVGGAVGYNVRLESCTSSATRLLFITTGVLLRRLVGDPTLSDVTHVILDEVHERDVNTDFLLILMRDLLAARPDLRLVVMSATLSLQTFVNYFSRGPASAASHSNSSNGSSSSSSSGGAELTDANVSVVSISGSTFPVTRYYLEDVLSHIGYTPSGVSLAGLGGRLTSAAAPPTAAAAGGAASGVTAATLSAAAPVVEAPAAGSSASSSNNNSNSTAQAQSQQSEQAEAFICTLCGRGGFASAEDFGVHAATCFGEEDDEDEKEENEDGGAEVDVAMEEGGNSSTARGSDGASPTSAAQPAASNPLAIALPGGKKGKLLEQQQQMSFFSHSAAAASSSEGTGAAGDAPSADPASAALLEAYQSTLSDEDAVDTQLVTSLLVHIVTQARAAEQRGAKGGNAGRPSTPAPVGLHSRSPAEAGLGAVLVFLPGWEEISRISEACASHPLLGNPSRTLVLPLHSAIPTAEQRKVFRRPPPGVIKVILATNIAETSLTIDDVVYVIDAGRAREKSYDAYTGCSALTSVWISQSAARQRAGRAGRVRPGIAFHLYSRTRASHMAPFTQPEMLRTPLEELCLQIKLLQLSGAAPTTSSSAAVAGSASSSAPAGVGTSDVERFLARAVEPPPAQSVAAAVTLLREIGAFAPSAALTSSGRSGGAVVISGDDVLTPLGHRLAALPMSPRLGKMLLWGAALRVLDPVLTIACAASYRPPFLLPMHAAERKAAEMAKLELSRGSRSDHLTLLAAFNGFLDARARGGGSPGNGSEFAFCRKYYLSAPTLNMVAAMRTQLLRELADSGALDSLLKTTNDSSSGSGGPRYLRESDKEARDRALLASASVNSSNTALVLAALAAGLYPSLARHNPPSGAGGGGGGRRGRNGDDDDDDAGGDGFAGPKPGLCIRDSATLVKKKPQLHPSSVNSVALAGAGPAAAVAAAAGDRGGREKRLSPMSLAGASSTATEWLCFDEMSSVGSHGAVALRGTSLVPAHALALLLSSRGSSSAAVSALAGKSSSSSSSASAALAAELDAVVDAAIAMCASADIASPGVSSGFSSSSISSASPIPVSVLVNCVESMVVDDEEEAKADDDGEEEQDDEMGGGAGVGNAPTDAIRRPKLHLPPIVAVDAWVQFRLQDVQSAVALCLLRRRIALAFHRCVIASRSRVAADVSPADTAVLALVSNLLSLETTGRPSATAAPASIPYVGGGGMRSIGGAPSIAIAQRPASSSSNSMTAAQRPQPSLSPAAVPAASVPAPHVSTNGFPGGGGGAARGGARGGRGGGSGDGWGSASSLLPPAQVLARPQQQPQRQRQPPPLPTQQQQQPQQQQSQRSPASPFVPPQPGQRLTPAMLFGHAQPLQPSPPPAPVPAPASQPMAGAGAGGAGGELFSRQGRGGGGRGGRGGHGGGRGRGGSGQGGNRGDAHA